MPFDEHHKDEDGGGHHNNGGRDQLALGDEFLFGASVMAQIRGYCPPCFARGVVKSMMARLVGLQVASVMRRHGCSDKEAAKMLLLDLNEDIMLAALLVHKKAEEQDDKDS